MEASGSLPCDSFKSKKIIRSSSTKPSLTDEATKANSGRSPWSAKTHEKPVNPPRRARNCRAALSLKEVREAAVMLRSPRYQPDPVGYDIQQIVSESGKIPIEKPKKKVNGSIKLPEKYEILGKLFDSLDSSVRLLRLKGSRSTFTNISPKVEYLTDRRFSYSHLAQLKFILPEVIEIEKILVHDERTSCMKPDLHVTMNVDAIKNEGKLKSASGNSNVRKIFRCRLLDFIKSHHEEDVPEGILPEPFNKSKLDLRTTTTKASPSSLLVETSINALAEQQPAAATHLSQIFQKRFSQPFSRYKPVPGNQEQAMISCKPAILPIPEPHVDQSYFEKRTGASAAPPISKLDLKQTSHIKSLSQASVPLSRSPATPMKERDSIVTEISIQGTPAKVALTPVKLMSATPALQQAKRGFMSPLSPDGDSTSSPNKLVRRPLRSRSLKFDSPVKNAKAEDEVHSVGRLSVDDDIFKILPESLLQSIREKERKAVEEKDPAISQAKRRQKMIASLPKLFDMIRFLFQSIKRSVITKEELMHKIMAGHLDIADRREVEEQLKLLLELVPEWIYEKLASSGDLLICVKQISSPESMRTRLVEAK